jgi:transcription initiation factor TFIIF subunit alpha
MRFHGNKEVDPTKFTQPVKLHRKKSDVNFSKGYVNYKYNNQGLNKDSPTSVDKKDGGPAAASGSGTPAGSATGADTTLIAPYGGGVRNKQMLFKKRTRQIYIANEEERKKKEIEAAPWVIEDDDAQNTWTGQLEGGQHANYVLFVFSTDGFKVVPADKWYKFTPKIQYAPLTAEEAEEQVILNDLKVTVDVFILFIIFIRSFIDTPGTFSIKKRRNRTTAASVG